MIPRLLSYLILVPGALLCCLPMGNQLRYSRRRTLAVGGLTLAVLICLAAWADQSLSLPRDAIMVPVLAVCFPVYHRCLRVSLVKSLSVFAAILSLLSVLDGFAIVYDALRNPSLGMISFTLDRAGAGVLLSWAAVLVLWFPFLRFGTQLVDSLELPRVWLMTLPFSLMILVLCLNLRPIYYETLYVNRVFHAYIYAVAGMLLLWCMLAVAYYFIVTGILDAARTAQRNRFLEMQESQFLAQQRYIESTARHRHDFRHSIRTLTEMYDAGDLDALGRYLHEYEQSMPANEVARYCGNTALNALLNYYAHSAAEKGIDSDFQIRLPDRLPVSDMDLCSMIGNILENAIMACGQGGFLRLTVITEEAAQLYIVATNSFRGSLRKEDGVYVSTSRSGRGIGLVSIASTAEKYGGVAQFTHRGQEFYSNVAIPLR